MNDFTKEELEVLRACVNTVAYKSLRAPFDLEPELCFLRNKIQFMIDNYDANNCPHEYKKTVAKSGMWFINMCHKCHDEKPWREFPHGFRALTEEDC